MCYGSGDMELIFDSGRLLWDSRDLRVEMLNIIGSKPMVARKIINEILRRHKIHFRYGIDHHERMSLAMRVKNELNNLVECGIISKIEGNSRGPMYYRNS